jgi:hypothetical protein
MDAEERMIRTTIRAVEADQQRADAVAARDAALEEQKLAQEVVDLARMSTLGQINKRADDLGRRLDAFARKQARAHLDSLPDPDEANPGGELSPIPPATPREPVGDQL